MSTEDNVNSNVLDWSRTVRPGVRIPPNAEWRETETYLALLWSSENEPRQYMHVDCMKPVAKESLRVMARGLGSALFNKIHPNVHLLMIRRQAKYLAAGGTERFPPEDKELWQEYFALNPESELAA